MVLFNILAASAVLAQIAAFATATEAPTGARLRCALPVVLAIGALRLRPHTQPAEPSTNQLAANESTNAPVVGEPELHRP